MNKNESLPNLLHAIVDVKFFAKMSFGVEETRPEHCARCGVAAGSLGALRIHGHGTRQRDVWGLPMPAEGTKPEVIELVLRRYRCLACGHVMTVRPPFVAHYFRYATATIGLVLWLWGVVGRSVSQVRREVSPWSVRGMSEPHRWRSVARWLERLEDLFKLPAELGCDGRDLARRVGYLVAGRAPPELQPRARAFVGAQLR